MTKSSTKTSKVNAIDDIPHCDTLSTESPSNSYTSISPVNGDEIDDNQWIFDRPANNDVRKPKKQTKRSSNKQSLNDGVILSHLQIGEIVHLKDKHERDDVLIAPSTIEERQNEKYARKVGIHL